jgi:pilus assembly protein Flp/PilA
MWAASTRSRYWRDEEGATAIEYGLIVMVIGMALVGIFAMGGSVDSLFGKVDKITEATSD